VWLVVDGCRLSKLMLDGCKGKVEEVGGAIICTAVALASDCDLALGSCAQNRWKNAKEVERNAEF